MSLSTLGPPRPGRRPLPTALLCLPIRRIIGPEEKAHLRLRVLDLLREEDSQIAVQLSVLLAKVARVDHPRDWPDLFDRLLGAMGAAAEDMLMTRRLYLTLHHVVKELASKRLAADQRAFEELTQHILPPLWDRWGRESQDLLEHLPPALQTPALAAQVRFKFERWLFLLKMLRRLVCFGFPSDARTLEDVPMVPQFVDAVLQLLGAMLPLRPPRPDPRNQLLAMLDRGLLKLVKSVKDAQDTHPWSFRLGGSLARSLDFFGQQVVSGPLVGEPVFSKFKIQCMLLLNQVLQCSQYRGSGNLKSSLGGMRIEAERSEARDRIDQLEQELLAGGLAQFLQPQCLGSIMAALVERYLPFREEDVTELLEEPEQFHHDADRSSFEEQLRPCAETLYVSLLERDREGLGPFVVELLQKSLQACPPGSASSLPPGTPSVVGVPYPLLAKEAVYNAVGTGSYELHDFVDYTSWLQSALLLEIQDKSPVNTILRRRVAILLGQFVAKLPDEARDSCYRVLVEMLSERGSIALQLAALSSLRLLIDDWGFYEDQFGPYVGPTIQAAIQLLP